MPSLGATFGRGAATTAQWDIANSDCIVIMGSNMAENHPIAFRFVMEAKTRGATVIHADPRFTRTSALADIYAPVRCGTDIAFVGGLINYVIQNDLWFREYAINYTNISTIINKDFKDAGDDGFFSGWEEEKHAYVFDTWQYEGETVPSSLSEHHVQTGESYGEKLKRLEKGPPPVDETLQHPNCVYQILRRHYARYTPEMVERITGCPKETFLAVAKALAENSGRDRTSAWCYAVGWTHHSTGVQMIRAAAILQALLGNVGRPGGGVLALRGHASIQGSTDVPTLYNMLPGYLRHPNGAKDIHKTFEEYIRNETVPTGFWHHFPGFAVSLLKAWYGARATKENGWGFDWIAKIMGDHSQLPMSLAIKDRAIRGLMLLGQNPVIGGLNSRMIREGLGGLDWLVVRETFENESASFWYRSPEVEKGELRPRDIGTEIFLLPAALPGEKAGTVTNTHRLVQWHDKVVEPPGDCRSDLWFMYHLGRRLKALYAGSTDPKDEPIRNLAWDYPTEGPNDEPSAEAVLKEMNGYHIDNGAQLKGTDEIKSDGSTACGVWIYCGVYPEEGRNRAQSRKADGRNGPGSHLEWAWAWPDNRRVLYNRASADPDGRPWSERKRYIWWDEKQKVWTGMDVPDFQLDKPPEYRPDWSKEPKGMDALCGTDPFTMIADGRSSIFVPSGLKDAPLPTHYEPVESPVRNLLYRQQDNPAAKKWHREDNPYHKVADERFPYAITTYRLTEHHSGAIPTRMVPATAELQPGGFIEIPPELAEEQGIVHMDWVVVSTARGEIETRALVTRRLRPFRFDGRTIYQVGMPWHFGWHGYATGAIANVLTSVVGDPNTTIHEGKAFTCNIRKR